MDKYTKYPKTIASQVLVDSDGTTLGSTLAGISNTTGNIKALSTSDKSSIVNAINELNSKYPGGIFISITWADLKNLKDNSALTPGVWYRITDYVTRTFDEGYNYPVANHYFDIIVRADSNSVLNENAFACQSERDTDGYFANSNLGAWVIKYDIDNDDSKYEWVNTTSGTGVIYYMKDEFDNECCYDFKNILFSREYNEETGMWSKGNEGGTTIGCYTFSNELDETSTTASDMSLSISNEVYNNTIKALHVGNVIRLNNTVFFGTECFSNYFDKDSYNNTFGNSSYMNHFGYGCSDNIFFHDCSNNIIGSDCCNNTIGKNCVNNVIGDGFRINTFKEAFAGNSIDRVFMSNTGGAFFGGNSIREGFSRNTMGDYFQDNQIGIELEQNTFGRDFEYNIVGNYCYGNSFGDNAEFNHLGNYLQNNDFGKNFVYNVVNTGARSSSYGEGCARNTIGAYSNEITFGDDCSDNSIGNGCEYITFGSTCMGNTVGNSSKYCTLENYYRYCEFKAECLYITLSCESTTTASSYVQNVTIAPSVNGRSKKSLNTIQVAGSDKKSSSILLYGDYALRPAQSVVFTATLEDGSTQEFTIYGNDTTPTS